MKTDYATNTLIVLAGNIRREARQGRCADELAAMYQRDTEVIKRVLAMHSREGAAKVLKDDDNSLQTVKKRDTI